MYNRNGQVIDRRITFYNSHASKESQLEGAV